MPANMLLPEQISQYWDLIKFAIASSDPERDGESEDRFTNTLNLMLSGKAQCWFGWTQNGSGKIPKYIAVTMIITNPFSGNSDVLIDCLFGLNELTDTDWAEAWELVSKWGRANSCTRVVAYANVPKVIEMAKHFNGTTSYTYLAIPIAEE